MRHHLPSRRAAALILVAWILAAPCLAAEGGLPEVVVTAQKREQSLQDVSLSVTAVDSARLQENFVLSLEDIQFIAPSVSFGNSLGFAKIFIRGIGLNEQTTGIDPSVALHVDGAVINQPIAHFTSVFDLERVEVLRGPQGTLYGRNATGGSINLVTRKPTQEFEANVRATAGNHALLVGEGAISGPLTDRMRARAAFRIHTRDGYGINEATGTEIDDANQKAARLHVQFDLTESMDLLLSGEWFRQHDRALGLKFKRATYPSYETATPAAFALLRPLGLGGFPTRTRNFASEFDPSSEIETWATTGTLSWDLGERVRIVNIANYREVSSTFIHDLDMSAVTNGPATTAQPPSIQSRFIDGEQASDELQFHYTGERLSGLVGLYYFTENLHGDNRSGQTPGVESEPIQRVLLFGDGDAESFAAFTQWTWAFTDQFSFKLGGRFTSEDRQMTNSGSVQPIINNGMGLGAPIPQAPRPGLPLDRSFDEFTPLAGVEWRPADDLMVFYTYSEGFKSGVGLLGQFETGIADPETIENHELGFKSSWLQQRLTLNVSAFSYELQDLQLGRTLPDPLRGFVNRFENAAEMEGKGIETELAWAVTDRFEISAALDWLDAEFTDFTTIDQFDPDLALTPMDPSTFPPISYAGNRPRNAPEWSYNVHGAYGIPLGGGAELTFAADVSYKSEQFYSEFNNDVERAGAYTLLDARVTYMAPDERWGVSLWGKNLTDELVEAGAFVVSLSRTVGRTYLPPRTWGVTLDYRL